MMKAVPKNTVLLLGHNNWQERSLGLALRLGGYEVRVAQDSHETINLVKTVSEAIHSIVLPGTGNPLLLAERLQAFNESRITTPIVLIGASISELERLMARELENLYLKVTCCSSQRLLECLGE